MGDLDRASMVAKNVALNNRIDQVSEVMASHGHDLTAHKAELNRLDTLQKLTAAAMDAQRVWENAAASHIEGLERQIKWLMLPWYTRWFTQRP